MVIIIMMVMVMVVVMIVATWRTTQFLESLLQGFADRVHLCGRLFKSRDDPFLALVGHDRAPFIEFGNVAAVVLNPMLEKYPELFFIVHCCFLESPTRQGRLSVLLHQYQTAHEIDRPDRCILDFRRLGKERRDPDRRSVDNQTGYILEALLFRPLLFHDYLHLTHHPPLFNLAGSDDSVDRFFLL
jgi:hypothetical protein